MHLFKELRNGIGIVSRPKQFLSYGSKQSKCCLDQYLMNCLAYLNFDAIFEFLGQVTINKLLLETDALCHSSFTLIPKLV